MKLPIPRAYKYLKKQSKEYQEIFMRILMSLPTKPIKKSNKIYKEFDINNYTFKELRFGDLVIHKDKIGIVIGVNPKGNNKKRRWNYYLVIYENALKTKNQIVVFSVVREDKLIRVL